MTTIFLAILAHVIADFPLQTSGMATKKSNLKISGYLVHGLVVLGTQLILLQGYQLQAMLPFSLVIFVTHIIIDFLKNILCRLGKGVADLAGFLIDQGLHLAVIISAWPMFQWEPNTAVRTFYQSLLPAKAIMVFQQSHLTKGGPALDHILAGAIIYILVCFGGAVLVRKILNVLDDKEDSLKSQQKVGAAIGLMERLIIITLALCGSLGSIAFILTAKSIARFNELNDRRFAEYYLVGTLTSTAIAICGGIFLKYFITL